MSTAGAVPETFELDGDDARQALSEVGFRHLLADAGRRLRWADGFSHARSLAFTIVALLIQGVIAVVGLATALGRGDVGEVVQRTFSAAVPGPGGEVLTAALDQAGRAGSGHRWLALVLGGLGSLVTGTTATGQLERGLNRVYGVEQDRPTRSKYGRAAVLTATGGGLAAAGFVALALGRGLARGLDQDGLVAATWSALRWPLGVVLLWGACSVFFQRCPNRRQPQRSWLAFGAAVAVVLWSAATVLLAGFFHLNPTFGATYGPLAGVLGLMLWAYVSSIAVLYGGAVAAQLEAVRAGRPAPQDPAKADGAVPAARVPQPA